MSYQIDPAMLEQLAYPNGRGQYHYGNTPIQVNQKSAWSNMVQPGGVSAIGSTPVATGTVATTNPALGVTAGQTAATGMPQGAAMGGAGAGAMGAANVAGFAINAFADVAKDYYARKAQVDTMRSQRAIPNVPESQGALAAWQPPGLSLS